MKPQLPFQFCLNNCQNLQHVLSKSQAAVLIVVIDEAGFDVLIGSAESQVPSSLYSEKAYVMAKGFIKTALTTPPPGLVDVVQWLYLTSQPGPQLLRRVVNDSKKLLANNATESTADSAPNEMEEKSTTRAKLSTGASILLRRHVKWLEDFMTRNDEGVAVTQPGGGQ